MSLVFDQSKYILIILFILKDFSLFLILLLLLLILLYVFLNMVNLIDYFCPFIFMLDIAHQHRFVHFLFHLLLKTLRKYKCLAELCLHLELIPKYFKKLFNLNLSFSLVNDHLKVAMHKSINSHWNFYYLIMHIFPKWGPDLCIRVLNPKVKLFRITNLIDLVWYFRFEKSKGMLLIININVLGDDSDDRLAGWMK